MSSLGLIAFFVLFAIVFVVEWQRLRSRCSQSAEWEREMKATSWRDRRRIASEVRQGKRLDNPRDARLAVGMAQQQLDLNGSPSLRGTRVARFVLGAALLVLGLLAGEATVVVLGLILIAVGGFEIFGHGRLTHRLERSEHLNREQASLETDRPWH